MINGAQLGSVIQGLRKVSNYQAQHALEGGPTTPGIKILGNQKEKKGVSPKGISKASVKGKKDFARTRLHKAWSPGVIEGGSTQHPSFSVSLFDFAPNEGANMSSADGDQQQRDASNFHFNAKPRTGMGNRPKGASCEAPNNPSAGREVILVENLSMHGKRVVQRAVAANCNLGNGQQVCHEALTVFPNGNGALGSLVFSGDGIGNRADKGMAEANRMEFEGRGDANAA
ncbi:hypothetical protein SO802_004373 [Lithocarpus litseifolius]|uniref:Uncharacterized protein n=1 Tax=Lithocarpus litseifolius TaxID=425828 RepID=A0AAW2E6R9_9ROSI